MPLRTRRSSMRGTPRGLFGNIGLMAAHSKSVSSYPMIRSSGLEALNHHPADNLNTAGIRVASTAAKRFWLFREHSSRRSARRLFRRRDHERHPGVPAVGPVVVGE